MASHAGNRDFQKCGEVTMAVQFGSQIYALNCIFCGMVCLRLDTFAVHIEDHHANQLHAKLRLSTENEVELAEGNKSMPELGIQITSVYGGFVAPQEETKVPATNIVDGTIVEPLINMPIEFPTMEEKEEVFELALVKENIDFDKDYHISDHTDAEPLDEEAQQLELCKSNYSQNNSKTTSIDSDVECGDKDQIEEQDTDDRELTLAIIECYEKHRVLWDPSEPTGRNYRKHDQAAQQIANTINKQLGLNLLGSDIRRRIRTMRCKFRRELRHRDPVAFKRGSGKYKPLWYYDKLTFLNTIIKYKPHKKRVEKASKDNRPALPLPNITNEQNQQLIEIYKGFSCLWNVQDIDYRFKKKRQDALENMLKDIKTKINLDFDQDELQKMLHSIRYACTQEKYRKLRCERQEETYKPICLYHKEISFLEDYVSPFRCDFCEEVLISADQYMIHKSQHDGSLPFVCPVCSHGFIDSGNYIVHIRRHTRDYRFKCELCDKRHATSTELQVHMRYHTGHKPYLCPTCGKSFRAWTYFDEHMRRHEKRPSHICTVCSKVFFEKRTLKEHMKGHLNIRDQVCNVCGKGFTRSKYLRLHQQLHAENKKYKCKICGKYFAQHSGLTGHMKSHGTTVSGRARAVESIINNLNGDMKIHVHTASKKV